MDKEQVKAAQKQREEEIIQRAIEFERALAEPKGAFKTMLDIIKKSLDTAEEEEKELREISVGEMIEKGEKKYIYRLLELETKTTVLKNLIAMPQDYIEAAKRINEKKDGK